MDNWVVVRFNNDHQYRLGVYELYRVTVLGHRASVSPSLGEPEDL